MKTQTGQRPILLQTNPKRKRGNRLRQVHSLAMGACPGGSSTGVGAVQLSRIPSNRSCWRVLSCRGLVSFLMLATIGAWPQAAVAQDDQISARIHSSGIARYVPNRWATVKGVVINPADDTQSILMVVKPPAGQNVQYARRLSLPGHTYYETQWPVLIPREARSGDEFRTLVFPGGEEDGVIRRRDTDVGVASFNAIVRATGNGLSAWFAKEKEPPRVRKAVLALLQAVRFLGYRDTSVIALQPREFLHFPEALGSLDQLCITTSDLPELPNLAEAIRLWVQRGGRLILMLDQTGLETARTILGDALPMTVVGVTSDNRVQLDLNPVYSAQAYQVRTVDREFDEPVRWLRVAAEAGEFIWTLDGWPVAIRLPYGRGQVLVTMIDPSVFTIEKYQQPSAAQPASGRFGNRQPQQATPPPFDLIPSSRRMTDTLLETKEPPLLDADTVLANSTNHIGYSIPGRMTASLLVCIFPVSLFFIGLWFQKRNAGERLSWIVPLLSLSIAVPIVAAGMLNRSVAPQTILETYAIQSLGGQTQLVSDGFAVTYNPTSGEVRVQGTDGSVVDSPAEPDNTDTRRLLWTSASDSEWVNLSQSSGIQRLPVRAVMQSSRPFSAVATFDSEGVVGTLESANFANPSDAIFASESGLRMSVHWTSTNTFRIGSDDALRANLFLTDSLMSETQVARSGIYASLFAPTRHTSVFPATSSLLCWFDNPHSSVKLGSDDARRVSSVLLVQPLAMRAPDVDTLITIPSGFLPYRAIASKSGSISTVYNNAQKQWVEREGPATTLLEFLLPGVCLPFKPQTATITVRIRAGSRQLRVLAGPQHDLKPVTTIDSPVGTYEVQLPLDSIATTAANGRMFVEFQVSDLDAAVSNDDATGEQDDSWLIESLELTLTGQRAGDRL
jgi:hypothetical protein